MRPKERRDSGQSDLFFAPSLKTRGGDRLGFYVIIYVIISGIERFRR